MLFLDPRKIIVCRSLHDNNLPTQVVARLTQLTGALPYYACIYSCLAFICFLLLETPVVSIVLYPFPQNDLSTLAVVKNF